MPYKAVNPTEYGFIGIWQPVNLSVRLIIMIEIIPDKELRINAKKGFFVLQAKTSSIISKIHITLIRHHFKISI